MSDPEIPPPETIIHQVAMFLLHPPPTTSPSRAIWERASKIIELLISQARGQD